MTTYHISRRGLIAGGFAGAAAAPTAWAQEAVQAAQAETPILPSTQLDETETDVPTETDRKSLRMTAPVILNGKGPYDFFLDTGANRSAISGATASRLGLRRGRPMRIHTLIGPVEVPSAQLDSLRVRLDKALATWERETGALEQLERVSAT